MAGGNEPSDQVDQEVDRAAMARMIDRTEVLSTSFLSLMTFHHYGNFFGLFHQRMG